MNEYNIITSITMSITKYNIMLEFSEDKELF